MLEFLGRRSVLAATSAFAILMFTIVMFIVDPHIDGGDGMGVIKLQLAFEKETGMEIVRSWGASGASHFRQWIFTDYLYAFAYALFFASLLALLIRKRGKSGSPFYVWAVYLPFAAGIFDWIENTMEVCFLDDPVGFPDALFTLHSVISSLKWATLPIVAAIIAVLLIRNKSTKET